MAKFSEVFSTTLKVIGALFLISLGLGVLYLIVGGAVSTANKPEERDNPWAAEYKKADDTRTTMPQSKWNTLVAQAIKQHCALQGMSKEEIEKALGKPTTIEEFKGGTMGDTWKYSKVNKGKCLKYSGDACVQYQKDEEILFFSLNGYNTGLSGEGCLKEPIFSMRLAAGL